MSGRSCMPINNDMVPQRTHNNDNENVHLTKAERKLILQQLHDYAQIGDMESVKQIFDNGRLNGIHVNITRKGRNTTLHTALLHNQEGPLIDYLIQNGADVNIENTKGYCPITLAIIHCKGSKAVEKLIVLGGAKWEEKFDTTSAFADMTVLDVAIQCKNEIVVSLLKGLMENGICQEVTTNVEPTWGHAMCPICNQLVKFPTEMSKLEVRQESMEKRIQNDGEFADGEGRHKRKKYISRKYMDQLLAHSDGEAYKKLCGVEYHSVENMRLRKEISESYGVLHAVQECCISLGISTATTKNDNINLDNTFLIDLCSGKGITTALCGALNNEKSNSYFLAVDKMLSHTMPHFLNEKQIQYLCRDVMAETMFEEIAEIVRYQTREQGRTCILVGMHLCGMLSERAIDLFERIEDISGLVLSPCCLPKKHEQHKLAFTKGTPEDGESADLFSYFKWSEYLKERVEGVYSSGGVSDVRMYRDNEMHTEKNTVIVGVRK